MAKKQILNIVNFIRGCEPRCEVDLYEPVREQIALLERHGFRGTFLLQYDALIDPAFLELMKSGANRQNEIGVWLEIVEPLCRAAGIPWRGRFPWDWHADVGFSVGYTPADREKLIDVLFAEFKRIFGFYPRVMGSWIIDAHTLRYAAERYGLDASCNCKDQWGTDGYTLWGAYYNGAYYPSRSNAFAPAQERENAIDVPVFRMLGSDPVDQYDFGLDPSSGAPAFQGVVTLEPVYSGPSGGGGEKKWIDWFLSTIYNGKCLSHAYTQAGQENSFGWPAMRRGLEMQFEAFAALREKGVVIETLGESGRWFKETHALTPAAAIVAEDDWKMGGRRSVWYSSRFFRANLFADREGLRLRDLTLFSDSYRERYLDAVCDSPVLKYDNLPVIDGNRFSGGGVRAGGYLLVDGAPYLPLSMECREEGEDCLSLLFRDGAGREVSAVFRERTVALSLAGGDALSLSLRYDPAKAPAFSCRKEGIAAEHNGFSYILYTSTAPIFPKEEASEAAPGERIVLNSENRRIRLSV